MSEPPASAGGLQLDKLKVWDAGRQHHFGTHNFSLYCLLNFASLRLRTFALEMSTNYHDLFNAKSPSRKGRKLGRMLEPLASAGGFQLGKLKVWDAGQQHHFGTHNFSLYCLLNFASLRLRVVALKLVAAFRLGNLTRSRQEAREEVWDSGDHGTRIH